MGDRLQPSECCGVNRNLERCRSAADDRRSINSDVFTKAQPGVPRRFKDLEQVARASAEELESRDIRAGVAEVNHVNFFGTTKRCNRELWISGGLGVSLEINPGSGRAPVAAPASSPSPGKGICDPGRALSVARKSFRLPGVPTAPRHQARSRPRPAIFVAGEGNGRVKGTRRPESLGVQVPDQARSPCLLIGGV